MNQDIALMRGARAPEPKPTAMRLHAVAGNDEVALAGLSHIVARFDGTWSQSPVVDLGFAAVRFRAAPWTKLDVRDLEPEGGRRTFIVSAMGWCRGVWFDGPLAHVGADGGVVSYVPSGGAATLSLPFQPQTDFGTTASDALANEGSLDHRAHRCLMAAVDAHTPVGLDPIVIAMDGLTPRGAVALALLRQARPDATFRVMRAGGSRALPPPWRRFTENAGIAVIDGNAGRPLDDFAHALGSNDVGRLAARINSISAILPKSLVSQ